MYFWYAATLYSFSANVVSEWHPELKHHAPDVPILLVGLKTDARENPEVIRALADKGQQPVTVEQARDIAKKIDAAGYVECSALTQEGLSDCFKEAVNLALNKKKKKPKKRRMCTIM